MIENKISSNRGASQPWLFDHKITLLTACCTSLSGAIHCVAACELLDPHLHTRNGKEY